MLSKQKPNDFDVYIETFSKDTQLVLIQIRALIKKSAPFAEESLSYAMPAYKVNGKPLVYFAGYKNHIGLYALPSCHKMFSEQLTTYKQGKGSIQFPLNEPMPILLITKMIEYRMKEII